MKQVQKRFIYAGIVSAIFFLIIYGIMSINIIISLILTVLIYLGGTLLFKEKDIRELNDTNVNNYYFLASKCVNLANQIDEESITTAVEKVATYTDEIIVSLSQRPKKVEQVFDFFDYYLDITCKILMRYRGIQSKENKTPKDTEFIGKTNEYLKSIEEAFERQLSNMQEARMLDIESEVRMFEKMSGIKKTDIEMGVTKENE